MALNSAMHEIYLSMPIEANLLPELTGLPFWARMTHEIMLSVNPGMLKDLALANKLDAYLKKQQEQLSGEARKLEKEWRKNNPMSMGADYMQRASWINHSKQAAREILIAELTKSLSVLAQEQ
jgi:hypothetical protein